MLQSARVSRPAHSRLDAAVRSSHGACRPGKQVAARSAGAAAAGAAAEAAAAAAAAQSVKELLTRRSYAPPRFVGPVDVAFTSGKRYGITATENLSVGQLLLVVPPLAAVFGAAGSAPTNAELVQVLQGQQLTPWQLQWLRALNRHPAAAAAPADAESPAAESTTAPAPAAADPQLLGQLQQLLQQGSSSSERPGPDEPVGVASVLNPLAGEQLSQVVAENAFSVAAEDLGASLLRELDPESVTGLWPEYALINHSCQPNTTAVVIGRFLLLRAVAPVLAGEELTASYLGRRGLAPVAVRRAFLAGVYGFHCQCERCLAEQATFPTAYYPADNALLGMLDPQQPDSSSSSSSSSSSEGLLPRVLKALRLPGAAADGSQQQQQQQAPQPSPQHRLLLELYTEATEALPAAVQEAVAADSARLERQLALLQELVAKTDGMLGAVAAAAPQLQQWMQLASPQVCAAWLAAAAFPLLQLQVELVELLLASGQLLVDERVLLDQETPSAGSRAMAAAGAAAAARLSLARRAGAGRQAGRRGKQQQVAAVSGLQSLLAGLGLAGAGAAEDDGPLTKRQLLALYADLLEACLQVADAVARGSELHVSLALKHMDAMRSLRGGDAPETRLAEGLCSRAHAARYGVMGRGEGQQLLAALVSARRRRQLGVSLSQKMSVLAWEASVARD